MELNKIFLDLVKKINDQLSSSLPSLFLYTGYNKIENNVPVVVLEYKEKTSDKFIDINGLELIYKLRAIEKYKGSIVVLSLFSKEKLNQIQYPKKMQYPIKFIETSNVEFYHIYSLKEENIKQIANSIGSFLRCKIELSELVREDMVNLCINPKYIIEDEIHSLKNSFEGEELEMEILNQFENKIIPLIKKENIEEAKKCIQSFCKNAIKDNVKQLKECLVLLAKDPSLEDNTEKSENIKVKWEVLYIDDQENARKKIEKLFEVVGIKCHLAKDYFKGAKAFKEYKKISWVISDYRLETENNLDHYQGLDVLLKLEREFELEHTRKFKKTILTGKNSIIQQSARFLDKIDWYSKDIVFKDEIYFKNLISYCTPEIDQFFEYSVAGLNFESEGWNISKPTNGNFTFKELYFRLKEMPDWSSFNQLLNLESVRLMKEPITKVGNIIIDGAETTITNDNFEQVMKNRLMVRRFEIGYSLLKDLSFLEIMYENKGQRSRVRSYHGINVSSFKNLKNNKSPLTIEEKEFVKQL